MHNNPYYTLAKGTIGTISPLATLAWQQDIVIPIQAVLGIIVPLLVSVSLAYDIKKKWKEDHVKRTILDKEIEIVKEKAKAKHEHKHPVEDNSSYTPTDPTNFV